MKIQIPELSLVVLIGPSGAGKSTFAGQHFLPTEVLSSDACRGLVSDDPNDQSATNDAFDVLNFIARKRLAAGRLTVIDATNVQPEARKSLVALAREFHVLPVAIVLNLPENVCKARNANRPDRQFGSHVIRNQRSQLRRSLRQLKREGFRHRSILTSPEEVAAASVQRVPLWNNRKGDTGPFDFIGDVHGCATELDLLLEKLGYQATSVEAGPGWKDICYQHPAGRKAVFVGDLIDRGPQAVACLSIARNMVQAGSALCVPGNHDIKLLRYLRGKKVKIQHGLAETIEDIDSIPAEHQSAFKDSLIEFLDSLISHYVLDAGRVVVAHAGLKESMQGRGSGAVRSFALYGETTGETDEFGLPVRHNWALDYRGKAMVVYGHTPTPTAQWLNKTVNIDTGCVFGGELTAMRYPEQELVSVPAEKVHCVPVKPLAVSRYSGNSAQQMADDLLDADNVIGKRIVSTGLRPNITIREENATAALEVISRFAVDPRWLIYLPPTMSPGEASAQDGYLEHPDTAFEYFKSQSVGRVICQEKHMGSRAVVVVCRDIESAQKRFGIRTDHQQGTVYTRTGRQFFDDVDMEQALVRRLAAAMDKADFWNKFDSSWACFDCELMPWSAKAIELIKNQYAAVGAAARTTLPASINALQAFSDRGLDTGETSPAHATEYEAAKSLLRRLEVSRENVAKFTTAFQHYCWDAKSIDDLKLAPFHLLATETGVHSDQNHRWHMETIRDICQHDPDLFVATKNHEVDLSDTTSIESGVKFWLDLTSVGGEGMVVKPLDFISKGKKGLVQPAIKCRGQEYLRIIYGPDYDTDQNLQRLRVRHLGRKRSLALREFALGIESLARFVQRKPLREIHECVFGVLALESEPVDPRL
jgi:protein phosphatase